MVEILGNNIIACNHRNQRMVGIEYCLISAIKCRTTPMRIVRKQILISI